MTCWTTLQQAALLHSNLYNLCNHYMFGLTVHCKDGGHALVDECILEF